jgi:hypothetical protein
MLIQKKSVRVDFYQKIVDGILELGPRDISGVSRLTNIPYNKAITGYKRMRKNMHPAFLFERQ